MSRHSTNWRTKPWRGSRQGHECGSGRVERRFRGRIRAQGRSGLRAFPAFHAPRGGKSVVCRCRSAQGLGPLSSILVASREAFPRGLLNDAATERGDSGGSSRRSSPHRSASDPSCHGGRTFDPSSPKSLRGKIFACRNLDSSGAGQTAWSSESGPCFVGDRLVVEAAALPRC